MNEDRFWLLVSLKLSGEATPEEMAELEMLLKQYPELGLRAGMLDTVWQSRDKTFTENKEASLNRHMQRLSNYLSEPVLQYEHEEKTEMTGTVGKTKPWFRKRSVWFAGVAGLLLIIWLVVNTLPFDNIEPVSAPHSVSTKRGSKTNIQLPDGSRVWLNGDSRITYDVNFEGTLREVRLAGEAYFDVVRDEARPFVIHTSDLDVKVLGTAFNVRAYDDEQSTETALIHGAVEVMLKNDPGKKIILKPSEKLIVQKNDKQPLLSLVRMNYEKKDNGVFETLWVRNKLAFDNEPLENVARKMERWFDAEITITDEKLKKESFTGVFEEESLPEIMEALSLSGKFRYTMNKKVVTISR